MRGCQKSCVYKYLYNILEFQDLCDVLIEKPLYLFRDMTTNLVLFTWYLGWREKNSNFFTLPFPIFDLVHG